MFATRGEWGGGAGGFLFCTRKRGKWEERRAKSTGFRKDLVHCLLASLKQRVLTAGGRNNKTTLI